MRIDVELKRPRTGSPHTVFLDFLPDNGVACRTLYSLHFKRESDTSRDCLEDLPINLLNVFADGFQVSVRHTTSLCG